MKKLHRYALLYGLLFVGVLMAPLPSEADPSLTIAGAPVALVGPSCTSTDTNAGWDSCWYIPLLTYGGWAVTDATPDTNRARLLIADKDGAGTALDQMRFTGTVLTRAGGANDFSVVFKNYFANANPSAPANYKWTNTSGGVVKPIGNQNVAGDRVRLSGKGCFDLQTCTPVAFAASTNQDTGTWGGTVADNGKSKSYNFTPAESTVSTSCTNTVLITTKKCTPTIEETMRFNMVGNDVVTVNDSHVSFGGSCRDEISASEYVPQGPPPARCKALDAKFQHVINAVSKENAKYADSVGAAPFTICEEEFCDDGSGYGDF